MGSTWWVKLPLYAFLYKCFSEDLLVPVVDVGQKFFIASNEVCSIVGPDYSWGSTTGAKFFYSHHTATGVHAKYYFEVDSASGETCEKESPTFFSGPPHGSKEGSEIVYTCVRERGFFESKSFSREVRHHWSNGFSPSLAACNTPRNYCSQSCSQFYHRKALLYQSAQVVNTLMTMLNVRVF